jgi:hypothetical protein
MKSLLPLLSATLLLTYSCKKVDSSDLKDDVPYHQSYTVSYDKTYGTSAMASYRLRDINGVRVDLANGAGVSANGIAPTTDFLDKTLYRWNFTGTPDVNFVLTKNSGSKINNDVNFAETGNTDFDGIPVAASKAAGFSFTWKGAAITGAETLGISIATPDSGSNAYKSMSSSTASNTVTFTSSDLVNVKPGTLTVELIRTKITGLDNADGTSSGSIEVRFTTRKTLTLNP